MRVAFLGTPDFAVPTLDALIAAGHDVAAVYSQPPRPAGRGKAARPGAVRRLAEALGITVRAPLTLRDPGEQAAFAALDLDVAVVAAYGLILPQPILDAPRLGCVNVHASLLPRWRGAAPIQRAILAGDDTTGVTIMRMEKGLDTGPMLSTCTTAAAGKTAGELTGELAAMGAALMVEWLADPGTFPATPQPEAGVTYAAKIDKAEARIDFSRSAEEIERQVRAFAPAPGAWFEYRGERIRILQAEVLAHGGNRHDAAREHGTVVDDALAIACRDGAIRPCLVQRAGRGVMTAADLLRGFPIPAGTRLA